MFVLHVFICQKKTAHQSLTINDGHECEFLFSLVFFFLN